MRSITTEIYEELNKNRSPMGINRTDILQNILDFILRRDIENYAFSQGLKGMNINEESCFNEYKNRIIKEIKESFKQKDKL